MYNHFAVMQNGYFFKIIVTIQNPLEFGSQHRHACM